MAARVQLPIGQNVYLLLNSDIVSSVRKTDDGVAESNLFKIFFWRALSVTLSGTLNEGWSGTLNEGWSG